MRTLILVLRDQLDRDATVLQEGDPGRDAVAMTEADVHRDRYAEHKQRLALGFAAMRHYRDDLRDHGWTVHYQPADAPAAAEDAPAFLRQQLAEHQPERVAMT
ncbi:MAG: cryptochrome/photolyase family protein, partial [Salinibacter sp.]|uniref:cryptochrome/photolyase family protein n=1 Tax=Salinibacter sp. TaxID=2065818 RepID=UPI002FC2F020